MLMFFFFFFILMFLVFLKFFTMFLFMMGFYFPFLFLFFFDGNFLSKNSLISLDSYSFWMLVLTYLIVIFCVISFEGENWKNFFFLFSFFLLSMFLYFFFCCSNLFFFFFFFESSLFPTLFLILGWGSNIERIQSGFYLFYYTLFSSMPMMISIFFFLNSGFSLDFVYISFFDFSFMYFFFVFSFLVKMPMFLVHSWLPKAHVEAPVFGSMILAGILLKMGGYGIFRFSLFLKFFLNFNYLWIYISVWGGLLSSFICIRQVDMKCLVAFSSVSHMSLVIMGLFFFMKVSLNGCFYMMISHGFCSSALFYLVNLFYYRSGTRSIILNKGLLSVFPSLTMWWFMFCVMNMGCPPFLNLFGEIFLIIGSLSWSFLFFGFLMLTSFFSAIYNLILFTFTSHGNLYSNYMFLNSCFVREFYVIFLHCLPVILFFLKLDFF